MLYCQQCGAGNSADARFCNQCGGRIASTGEPGGPLSSSSLSEATQHGHGKAERKKDEPEPPQQQEGPKPSETPKPEPSLSGLDISSVSLSAIGVRSPTKAWAVLVGLVLGLVSLGAVGMWLAQQGESEPSGDPQAEQSNEPSEGDGVEIGEAIPEGAEPPEQDFVAGAPRAVHTRSATQTPPREARAERAAAERPERPSAQTTKRPATSTTPQGERAQGEHAQAEAPQGESAPSAQTAQSSTRPEPDWEQLAEETPDEMEEYSQRVRSVIRTYYARRAQGCFEHESRNNREVRGTVVVAFDIQADGNVQNSRVQRNTTNIDTLGACLARQVGSWRLPPPPDGPLAMQMPFSR